MTTQPRPALMTSNCVEYYHNPNPYEEPLLMRCQNPAVVRVTLVDDRNCYTKKLCRPCYDWLVSQIEVGRTLIEIRHEETITPA